MKNVRIDQEKLWVVRVRIISKSRDLKWISQVTKLKPGFGSFSKDDSIPKWLRPLEKAEVYDRSRLQLTKEGDGLKALQRAVIKVLVPLQLHLQLLTPMDRQKIKVEVILESYHSSAPVYEKLSVDFCRACTELDANIDLVWA